MFLSGLIHWIIEHEANGQLHTVIYSKSADRTFKDVGMKCVGMTCGRMFSLNLSLCRPMYMASLFLSNFMRNILLIWIWILKIIMCEHPHPKYIDYSVYLRHKFKCAVKWMRLSLIISYTKIISLPMFKIASYNRLCKYVTRLLEIVYRKWFTRTT